MALQGDDGGTGVDLESKINRLIDTKVFQGPRRSLQSLKS